MVDSACWGLWELTNWSRLDFLGGGLKETLKNRGFRQMLNGGGAAIEDSIEKKMCFSTLMHLNILNKIIPIVFTRLVKFSDLFFSDFNHALWDSILFLQIQTKSTFIFSDPTLLLLGICSIFDIVLNSTLKVCLYLKKQKSNCFQRGRLFRKFNFYCPVETLRREFKMAVSIIKKKTWVSIKCQGSGKKITCKATYVHFPGRTYSLPSKVVTCCPSMTHLAGQMFSEHRHFPLSHILWRGWGIFQCF